jgi:hypothetical protein
MHQEKFSVPLVSSWFKQLPHCRTQPRLPRRQMSKNYGGNFGHLTPQPCRKRPSFAAVV